MSGRHWVSLDDDVDRLLHSYREDGRARISITYKTPQVNAPTQLYRSMDKARRSEEKFESKMNAYQQTEREIFKNFGYEDVPFLFRPIESIRRQFVTSSSKGADLEMIARIGEHYVDKLSETQEDLIESLKHYAPALEEVESHLVKLEDRAIDLAERKRTVEKNLDSIGEVKERYLEDAPKEGSYGEKVLWKRGLRAIEKDERSLRSLNLRISQDLNQTIEFQKTSELIAETVEISYTMNSAAVSLNSLLVEQLKTNLHMYLTTSDASNRTIEIHEYLDKAARFSSLMTKATQERMTTVGTMFKQFTMPSGSGASAIAGGGLLDGLRGYLTQMQEAHDEVMDDHAKSMVP